VRDDKNPKGSEVTTVDDVGSVAVVVADVAVVAVEVVAVEVVAVVAADVTVAVVVVVEAEVKLKPVVPVDPNENGDFTLDSSVVEFPEVLEGVLNSIGLFAVDVSVEVDVALLVAKELILSRDPNDGFSAPKDTASLFFSGSVGSTLYRGSSVFIRVNLLVGVGRTRTF